MAGMEEAFHCKPAMGVSYTHSFAQSGLVLGVRVCL